MNWLESIYCYLQYEKVKQGLSPSYDNGAGNFMLFLCLVILIFGTFFLIITLFPNIIEVIENLLGGELIGQILISVLVAAIYPIIVKTIGKQENFERITEIFLKMSNEEQANIARKGARLFSFSMMYFVVLLLLLWYIST